MGTTIPEIDRKYLRSVQSELLSALCERINQKAAKILVAPEMSELDKFKALYQYIVDSDALVAQCFDDWRRSNLRLKVVMLHRNGLLTEEHLAHLSAETKHLLRAAPKSTERKWRVLQTSKTVYEPWHRYLPPHPAFFPTYKISFGKWLSSARRLSEMFPR